jgi:hypothetical protein
LGTVLLLAALSAFVNILILGALGIALLYGLRFAYRFITAPATPGPPPAAAAEAPPVSATEATGRTPQEPVMTSTMAIGTPSATVAEAASLSDEISASLAAMDDPQPPRKEAWLGRTLFPAGVSIEEGLILGWQAAIGSAVLEVLTLAPLLFPGPRAQLGSLDIVADAEKLPVTIGVFLSAGVTVALGWLLRQFKSRWAAAVLLVLAAAVVGADFAKMGAGTPFLTKALIFLDLIIFWLFLQSLQSAWTFQRIARGRPAPPPGSPVEFSERPWPILLLAVVAAVGAGFGVKADPPNSAPVAGTSPPEAVAPDQSQLSSPVTAAPEAAREQSVVGARRLEQDLIGRKYADVKSELLRRGYSPVQFPFDPENFGARDRKDFPELHYCMPTGAGICGLVFRTPTGGLIHVETAGEPVDGIDATPVGEISAADPAVTCTTQNELAGRPYDEGCP